MVHKAAIRSLLEYVCVDGDTVICHFRCSVKDKIVTSRVPFEPYDGKIVLSWIDIIFHPIRSYNRYYHTPITIYGNNCDETIVLKAFENISKYFIWSDKEEKYIYNNGI
ncbi:MAG: hypothetical protein ACI9TV_001371 [Sulfurimonas sp.]|jgi:hypothetical protein|uniref:hypothetical protein n=1 Tax=Sulfurimonas sp. TaxID=2022749 RepID=UPI0039E57D4F